MAWLDPEISHLILIYVLFYDLSRLYHFYRFPLLNFTKINIPLSWQNRICKYSKNIWSLIKFSNEKTCLFIFREIRIGTKQFSNKITFKKLVILEKKFIFDLPFVQLSRIFCYFHLVSIRILELHTSVKCLE